MIKFTSKDWLRNGIMIINKSRNLKVRIGSRKLFVDFPNDELMQLLEQIPKIIEKYVRNNHLTINKQTLEKINEELNSKTSLSPNKAFQIHFTNEYKISKNNSNWLKIYTRQDVLNRTKPRNRILLVVQPDWKKFFGFLDEITENDDLPLYKKYEYISTSRFPSAEIFSKNLPIDVKDEVKNISSEFLDQINVTIENTISELEKKRNTLIGFPKRYKEREEQRVIYSGYAINEVILSLESIKREANNGNVSLCYREMRKVLESSSWLLIADLLFLRKPRMPVDYGSPYFLTNKTWYKWSTENKTILGHLGKLKKDIYTLFENCGMDNGTREKIVDEVVHKINYPLILLLESQPIEIKSKSNKEFSKFLEENIGIAFEGKNVITKLAIENIISVLENEIDDRCVSQVKHKIENKINKDQTLVPLYPSNEFFISMVDFSFNAIDKYSKARSLYDNYSMFVHSYRDNWQIFPFSSVLEFKILFHEIEKFTKSVLNIYEQFIKAIK